MSDPRDTSDGTQQEAAGSDAQDAQARKRSMGEGIKEGLGVLSAFKDALEETIQEARERGDLSTDRAKEVMKEALDKAQTAAEGARGRLDFATQADLEKVNHAVDALKVRLDELEKSVFGATKRASASEDPAGTDEGATEADLAEGPSGG